MKQRWIMTALLGVALMASAALAQEQTGPNRADRQQQNGDRANRRQRMDPEQMRQQRMERIKQQLSATDEEWQVLQPVIDKVFVAQRNANAWGGMMGGRGGPGGNERQGNQSESDLQRASRELRSAVQDNAPDATIQERLAAFRAAREKAESALSESRKELRELVTPKQEAVLVVSGILE